MCIRDRVVDVPIAPDSYLYDNAATAYYYNLADAKAYLQQAGYADTDGDGFVDNNGTALSLTIIVNQNAANNVRAAAARLAAQQLENVGIRATVQELSYDAYEKALKAGNFDLAFCGFEMGADYDLSFLLKSGAERNYGRFSSSTMDALLGKCSSAVGEAALKTAYADLQSAFLEQLPILPLYYSTNTLVVRDTIKNVAGVRDRDIYRTVVDWYMYQQGEGQTN